MVPPSQPQRLRVGVLLTFTAQLLDLSGIDLFGMLDAEYLRVAAPQPLIDLAMSVQIYYIGRDSDVPTRDPVPPAPASPTLVALTAQARLAAPTSTAAPEVAPGALDVLMIPGPPPGEKQSAATLAFVRAHDAAGTHVLVVCTGCYVAAEAGILDGRRASGPRGLIPGLRTEWKGVEWDDQRRWVKDVRGSEGDGQVRELWTSGGITNGLEMVAAYIKEKYPGPLSETVCAMADVGERGEFYDSSVGIDNAWWLGQILRALIFGRRTGKLVRAS